MSKYLLLVLVVCFAITAKGQSQQDRILVYTKNGEGYVHDNIPKSIEAIKALGKQHGFAVDVSEDPASFTDENLKKYGALVFSNTNNGVFDTEAQKKAFVNYIEAGGGFAAIHSATGTERNWPWFHKLIGAKFERHAPFQSFTALVIDKAHASTSFLGDSWEREDEAYYFKKMNPGIHVLIVHDMTTVEDSKKGEFPSDIFGDVYPAVWTNNFLGSRQWYTSYGHQAAHYEDEAFRNHILGGILYVLGKE